MTSDSERHEAGVEQSPWCANCNRSIQKHDYPYKRIRFDGREKGSFCGRSCATSWLIRNDDRLHEDFFDHEAIGGGPRLITDGGRDQLGDEVDRDLPDRICGGCGQATFGGKLPELSVEYDGEEVSTRLCNECVPSAFDVVKSIQSNGGVVN